MAFFAQDSGFDVKQILVGASGSAGTLDNGKTYDSTKLYTLRKLEGEGKAGLTVVEIRYGSAVNFQAMQDSELVVPAMVQSRIKRVNRSLDPKKAADEVVSLDYLHALEAAVMPHATAGKVFKFDRAVGTEGVNTLFLPEMTAKKTLLVVGIQSFKGEIQGQVFDSCSLHCLVEMPAGKGMGYVAGTLKIGPADEYKRLIHAGVLFPSAVEADVTQSASGLDKDGEVCTAIKILGPLSLKPAGQAPQADGKKAA